MSSGPRPSPTVLLGGLAAAGAIFGHHFAYRLASSEVHHGSRLMEATGHRYFGGCLAVALGLVMAALVSFLRSRHQAPKRGQSPMRLGLYLAPRLVPAQIGAFLVLEAAERILVARSGVAGLLNDYHVQIGVLIQGAVALCAAGVLALLASVVDRVSRRASRPRPGRRRLVPAILPRVYVASTPAVAVRAGTISFRGPPNLFSVSPALVAALIRT